ncbi:MAG: hypothetical protein JNK46_20750 [Methylobacteriaceae bacterium]|nr:hypothetical protein [Methylobacteriaceae bacterium]
MRTIPNRFVLAIVGAFFVAALLVRLPLGEVGAHVGVALVVLVAGMTLGGFMSAGVWKLIAACALWLGPDASLLVFIAVSMGATMAWGMIGPLDSDGRRSAPYLPFAIPVFLVVLTQAPLGLRLASLVA